jgi:D-glycero-D-manno-heptose 1,7-bisphosphate phosphatase
MPRNGVVFVDRDGVIVRNRPDHVKSWSEVELIARALRGLRLLEAAERRVFVLTNQAAIGRGLMSRPQVDQIHALLSAAVSAAGGRIEEFLVCPHAPEEGCDCRKPLPGLLFQARDRLGVDLGASYVVGDFETDIAAAVTAGCQGILVLSGRTPKGPTGLRADYVADDLLAAARVILSLEEGAWQRVA